MNRRFASVSHSLVLGGKGQANVWRGQLSAAAPGGEHSGSTPQPRRTSPLCRQSAAGEVSAAAETERGLQVLSRYERSLSPMVREPSSISRGPSTASPSLPGSVKAKPSTQPNARP